MGTFLANVLEHLHKIFYLIKIVWNYHSCRLKQKETVRNMQTLPHCQNKRGPKLNSLFWSSRILKHILEVKELSYSDDLWKQLHRKIMSRCKPIKTTQLTTLTIAFFWDFNRVCFNLIDHSIGDVQRSAKHHPQRTKLMCNAKNIILWKGPGLEWDTFIWVWIKRVII